MGDYTLLQAFRLTQQYFPTRFRNRNRDVIKRIVIKDVVEVERHDLPGESRHFRKYIIESKSYPQYPPYYTGRDSRGRTTSYQRRISHEYDVTLEMDRMSLSTTNWKLRVGSGKKWQTHPPQSSIKTLYPATRRRLRRKASRSDNPTAEYRRLVEQHKRRAKYLDVGDYNSQVNGINGDWIFRFDYAYYEHGHRFGRNYYGNIAARQTNPQNIVALPKHAINVIEIMMERGLLTY